MIRRMFGGKFTSNLFVKSNRMEILTRKFNFWNPLRRYYCFRLNQENGRDDVILFYIFLWFWIIFNYNFFSLLSQWKKKEAKEIEVNSLLADNKVKNRPFRTILSNEPDHRRVNKVTILTLVRRRHVVKRNGNACCWKKSKITDVIWVTASRR